MAKKNKRWIDKLEEKSKKVEKFLERVRDGDFETLRDAQRAANIIGRPVKSAWGIVKPLGQTTHQFTKKSSDNILQSLGQRPSPANTVMIPEQPLTEVKNKQLPSPVKEFKVEGRVPDVSKWNQPVVREPPPIWSGKPTRGLVNGRKISRGKMGTLPKLWKGDRN